jgi:hypothetical protein
MAIRDMVSWTAMIFGHVKYGQGQQAVELIQQGMCHTVALPFTVTCIVRQKKNYGNSNISPFKNIIFKKSSKRNQNPSRYSNSITNFNFQHKPKYHLSNDNVIGLSLKLLYSLLIHLSVRPSVGRDSSAF